MNRMLLRFAMLALLLLVLLRDKSSAAEPTLPLGLKTFSSLPRTYNEIRLAHDKASTQACDYLTAGEPLEIMDFRELLTLRDENEKKRTGQRLNLSTRRQILTVGVEVAKEDVYKLPKLSASSITDYLNNHYVSFQARIQKDSRGTLYLHHRPIALTGNFHGAKITEDFNPAVAKTVREFHSLGIYLPLKTPPTPENLRTVALVHKHTAVEKNPVRPDADRLDERYEFLFIRARPGRAIAGSNLDLHVFATSDDRRKLHYLRSGRNPKRPADCTLKAEVFFTKYDNGGLVPAESAMRRQTINANASFLITELDAFTRRNIGTKGDAFDNLTDTLDAIIDGKVKPSGTANAAPNAAPIVPKTELTPAKK